MARWYISANGSDLPYRGQACDKAGVELGKYYSRLRQAREDLERLQRFSKQELKLKGEATYGRD